MMTKAKLLLILIRGIGLVYLAAALRAEEPPKVIRFGVVGTASINAAGGRPTSTGVVALAKYLGFFEEEFGKNGPEIQELYLAGTGPAQNEALAQGSLDFGLYGGVPNVLGLANGIREKHIGQLLGYEPSMVSRVEDSPTSN